LFQLPTNINYEKKTQQQFDVNTKKKIFQSIQQKYFFIKNFIDHILKIHFPNVSYDKIQENYITEVQNYQNNLKSLLQLLPKKSMDSSLTVEEILQMIQNQHALESITYRPPTTPVIINQFSESKLKFYSDNSELMKFINLYYPKGIKH